jgi:hypothetical protein
VNLGPAARPFPEFLAAAFPVADLERAEASIAVIDPDGTILWVNAYWNRFAAENGGIDWHRATGTYFDGIAPPLRDYYRTLFASVLFAGEVFEQKYECSSADRARDFHLRALPIERRALLLEHSLIAAHPHGPDRVESARTDYAAADGTVLQCSNCRRVRRPGTRAWDWVPALVAQLHPKVSHGICPSCVGFYWRWPRTKRP